MKSFGTIKGSTNTTFEVVNSFSAGKVGFRELGSGEFRVRVVPSSGVKLNLGSGEWSQPDSAQNRYSTVVKSVSNLAKAIAAATQALAEQSIKVALA